MDTEDLQSDERVAGQIYLPVQALLSSDGQKMQY